MIYIGSDHAGFKLKKAIAQYLDNMKLEYQDLGNVRLDKKDDYPDYGYKVAKAVVKKRGSRGILICGSSAGVCIVANKVSGIRAVAVDNTNHAKLSREHNNANILCISGWDTSVIKAKKIVKTFLDKNFSTHPRHRRRVDKIKKIEIKEFKND